LSQQYENPYFTAVRGVANAVGLKISRARKENGLSGSVGIWVWTWETVEEIRRMKKENRWDYEIPDVETSRRRISELADPRIEDPPNWVHLSAKFPDVDPYNGGRVRPQSTYVRKESAE
jgi:hypothetical protein